MSSTSELHSSDRTRTYTRATSVVFLKTNEPFGGLSNMAGGYPLHVQGVRILTSEALYQVCRFPHLPEVQRLIIGQASPMTAKMKSKPHRKDSRPDWDQVRVKVMRWCLRVKLVQNWPTFSELLLRTGDRPIVEESRKDDFWGANPVAEQSLVGMNVLGRLLMELREAVKSGGHDAFLLVEPPAIPNFMLFDRTIEAIAARGVAKVVPTEAEERRGTGADSGLRGAEQTSLFDQPVVRERPPPVYLPKSAEHPRLARLEPYPAMKDSGFEWLGDVPAHWEVKRLKYSTTINDEALPETTNPGFQMLYVDISSVDPIRGITSLEEMVFEDAPSRARRIVQDGDTVVSTVRTYLRAIAPIRDPRPNTIVSTGFAVLRPRKVESGFASYALRESGFVEAIVARSVGVSYPAVNASEIGTIPIPLPSSEEQRAIADFLDRETAQIDTLVAKKRTLIERLKEKRTALISRTVTRGLPPDAARAAGFDPYPKLKPSGVDWLGDVPEHWPQPRKLRFLAATRKHSFVNGPFGSDLLTTELETEGVPVVYIRDIVSGQYRRVSEVCVTPQKALELDFCRVDPGDLLIAKVGDPPGTATVYPEGEPNGIVTQDVIRLRVNRLRACERYVAYFLNSLAGQSLIDEIAIESTRMRVSLGDYKASQCLLPPIQEQEAIADFLDCETAKIDGMVAKVETAIARLQEYRTALITAAVTGKIDVRPQTADNAHETVTAA